MVRLNWTGWCGVAGVAVVATLFALPETGWVARLHVEYLVGREQSAASWEAVERDRDDIRRKLEACRYPKPSGPKEELYNALATLDHYTIREKLNALSDRYPNDALIQAELGRYASQIGYGLAETRDPASEPPRRKPQPYTVVMIRMLEKAGRRGEVADPDNAHFSLLLAAALHAQGKRAEAFAAMKRAAGKRRFSDYTTARCNVIINRLETAGRFGNYLSVEAVAIVVFPYFAHYKHLVREFVGTQTGIAQASARFNALRLAATMAKGSDTPIGILVAVACAKIAVYPQGLEPRTTGSKRPSREWLVWASDLQRRAQAAGVAAPGFDAKGAMRELLQDRAAVAETTRPQNDPSPDVPVPGLPTGAGMFLACLAVAPVALAFGFGQSRRQGEAAGLALPFLLPLAAFFLASGPLGLQPAIGAVSVGQVVLILSAFAFSWASGLRFLAPWLVVAIVAGGFIAPIVAGALGQPEVGNGFPLELATSLAMLASWALSRPRMPAWLAWTFSIALIVGLTVAAAAALLGLARTSTVLGTVAVATGAACLAAFFGPRTPIRSRLAVGPLLLAFALAYGLAVRSEVATDRAMGPYVRNFIEQGAAARDAAPSIDLEALDRTAR